MKSPLRASLPALFTFALTSSAFAVDFVKDVQPIFEAKCLECHNPNKVKGKLLMDTAANLLKGGETGGQLAETIGRLSGFLEASASLNTPPAANWQALARNPTTTGASGNDDKSGASSIVSSAVVVVLAAALSL